MEPDPNSENWTGGTREISAKYFRTFGSFWQCENTDRRYDPKNGSQ